MAYQFVLANEDGNALPGANLAWGRRLIFQDNRPTEARLSLSLQGVAAGEFFDALRNGIPQLAVYEDGTLRFWGHWHTSDGSSGVGEQSSVNLLFRDAYGELGRRYVRSADVAAGNADFNATDAGAILSQLITNTNTLSDTTLRVGSIATTVARDRSYEIGKQIGEAGIELTELIGGFDFRVDPLDPSKESGKTGELVILVNRGSLREAAKFEYGEQTLANLRGYTFSTQRPTNRVIGIGGGEPAIRAEKSDANSESTFRSQQATISGLDVSEQATLDSKASVALRPYPLWVTTIHPDPKLAPQFPTDLDIGDTVPVNIRDGSLEISQQQRVIRAELGIGDSDEVEDYVIGFDSEGNLV